LRNPPNNKNKWNDKFWHLEKSQTEFFYRNGKRIADKLILFEEIGSDIPKLLREHKINCNELPHENKTQSKTEPYYTYLDEETRKTIQIKYSDDFYNFSFDPNPITPKKEVPDTENETPVIEDEANDETREIRENHKDEEANDENHEDETPENHEDEEANDETRETRENHEDEEANDETRETSENHEDGEANEANEANDETRETCENHEDGKANEANETNDETRETRENHDAVEETQQDDHKKVPVTVWP
jgi:hypothetical protein